MRQNIITDTKTITQKTKQGKKWQKTRGKNKTLPTTDKKMATNQTGDTFVTRCNRQHYTPIDESTPTVKAA